MDFSFSISDIFKNEISKIKSNLLPEGFSGDYRTAWSCASSVSDVIDKMGLASANAQGLQKAITTGDRLRSVEHTVYLLTNSEGNGGKGVVVGLLKIGRKKLFVFDMGGKHHEMEPLCVLDFYIHESMQRMGCGKYLYEYMLQEEKIRPEHLAIDRPSEKFLAFLSKHYSLSKVIPQANNYVIYEEFFVNHPDVKSDRYRSKLDGEPRAKSWYGSVDSINSFSWITKPVQRSGACRPASSVGILLSSEPEKELSNGTSSKEKPSSPPAKGKSAVNGQKTNKTVSFPSPLIIQPKSPSKCDNEHKDLKFHHTPLW